MSDPAIRQQSLREKQPASPAPNLIRLYSLMALGLLVAIGIAVLIVLPFYHRR